MLNLWHTLLDIFDGNIILMIMGILGIGEFLFYLYIVIRDKFRGY